MPTTHISESISLKRYINSLDDPNRNVRKRALENLRIEAIKSESDDISQDEFFGAICKPLFNTFSDPVEKCRELSITFAKDLINKRSKAEIFLPYLIPILVLRLGQEDIVEPSEELRNELIHMISDIIAIYCSKVALYYDDLVKILGNTLVDPYAEVRKQSCKCTSMLAKAIPEQFHLQSESFIKSLMTSITHQHSRVRVAVIETVGDVLQYGNSKVMDIVVPHLAQRLFDQSPSVRMAVTKVVGNWLLDLYDRYSFFHKLLPLLLTSLKDDQPDIRTTADALWHDVGMKYAKENEDDIKDKLDFAAENPTHYPPNTERPNIGCRQLMFRHVSKILPGLFRDLGDWVPATRIKSSSLLPSLLLTSEEYMTQHLELILSGIIRACSDDEEEVVKNVCEAAMYIGYFIKPDIWVTMVLKAVESTQNAAALMILTAIIKGSNMTLVSPYLPRIAETLCNPDILYSVTFSVQQQLLLCIHAICDVCKGNTTKVGQQLFNIAVTVAGLESESSNLPIEELISKLFLVQGLLNREDLFRKHTELLLMSFDETYHTWTSYSNEHYVFAALLSMCDGCVLGENVERIIGILMENLNPVKDAAIRLKFFSLLSQLLFSSETKNKTEEGFSVFAVAIVQKMIIPNLVWSAGRTAGAVRLSAVTCLWTMLQSGVLVKSQMLDVMEELLTQLTSCLLDDTKNTRLIACRVTTRLFDLVGTALDQSRLHDLYPELLKRLDDSCNDVRLAVANTFLAYFTCFGDNYDADLYSAHLKAIYQGLLVHLDDPETVIQEAVLNVLQEAAKVRPLLLLEEVEAVKHKHRTPRFCQRLINTLTETMSNSV